MQANRRVYQKTEVASFFVLFKRFFYRRVKLAFSRRANFYLLIVLISHNLVACKAPKFEPDTLEGKSALLDAAYNSLTAEDCTSAIASIEPAYNSTYTDNQIRLARASAQACAAGLTNFFEFLGNLLGESADLAGPGFWKVMTKLFYLNDATALDKRITAGGNALDALFATVNSGTVISESYRINDETNNIGSILVSDRTDDANAYMIFTSMAIIGALQNRYGSPNETTFVRGQILGASADNAKGWTDATKVTSDACLYSAAVVSLFEAIDETSDKVSSQTGTVLKQISDVFNSQIALACNAGCRGATGAAESIVNTISYADTGCLFTDDVCKGSSTQTCIISLRNRKACTGVITDRASCAAAGVATYISKDPILGWQAN